MTLQGVTLPHVDGKFLRVEGRRFLVKGVAYGTFAPGEHGQFPPIPRVAGDFADMAAAGINTVRTYTVPTAEVLDAAADAGLRVMVGLPWAQHVAFLDDRQLTREIRRNAVNTVRNLGSHPAALMFVLGNEIPPGVVRWHGHRRVERFLRELYDEAKSAAPDSLLTYVNFPPTEYLEVECFDVCAFNVYLHSEADLRAYLARLQHVAGSKPLLLAEAGADSLRQGVDGQARIAAMHVRTAFAEGACGAVVFSWTDEWWRGGHAVDDWAFGLVSADRRPKPALAAVERALADAPFAADERARWPSVSVVVCAYDAADTIDDCLTSLAALTYPNFEVIVVNDGSRDATAAIARRHDGVRVIDVANAGLSAARNVGLAEATGEIVAYTDADVRVDPDWLTYLIQPLLVRLKPDTTYEVVGVGGPNVVPHDDPWVAQCVARAPGGPTHVLLDDRIAEHVPGCNMAFRRGALLASGGFNPVYLRAGDDVDVCWRLQAKGLRIAFAPGALVWHHHRTTIEAFWRQQVGYGEGEAWLQIHHPDKFSGGEMLWRGRIYNPLPFVRSLSERRVNTGMWGTAAFPSIYNTGSHPLRFLPHSAVWMAVSSALLLFGAIGLPSPSNSATWLLSAGAVGWLTTLARCARLAWRSDLRGLPAIGRVPAFASVLLYRTTIAWLHLLQPLARMRGRIRGMWSLPPREGPAKAGHYVHREVECREVVRAGNSGLAVSTARRVLVGATEERSFWSQSWVAHPTLLTEIAGALRSSPPAPIVELDDGWHADRDLSITVGRWGWLHARLLVEEHSKGCCLVRARTFLRPSVAGVASGLAVAVVLAAAASAALALRLPLVGALSLVTAAGLLTRGIWQTAGATAAFDRALSRVMDKVGMMSLPASAEASAGKPQLRLASSQVMPAAVLIVLMGSAAIGGLVVGRDTLATRTDSTSGSIAPDPRMTAGGGVAVGISGDLFFADPRQGVIRRLRPRPPLDSVWTADDIGSDGPPLLGNTIPFGAAADIALAPNGDLYVADARGNRICRIVRSTGQIVTVAGDLKGPSAVAVAASGDVYVADTLNNRVRVIDHATGLIGDIAGDLNQPAGLAVAPNGDLYIADTGHHRIRRVSADTGTITTVAGDGHAGISGDGGLATRARLAAPMGLALASTGRQVVLYVADSLNDRVRVIDPDGVIATLHAAGPVVAPTRLAYHPAGWLYVKDASPDGVTAIAALRGSRLEARTPHARRPAT